MTKHPIDPTFGSCDPRSVDQAPRVSGQKKGVIGLKSEELFLEVASVLPTSGVNGPGVRSVIWLQGCDLRCRGCCNPDFLEIRPARRVRIEVLLEWVLEQTEIEGITLSGGEPTLQAKELVPLCKKLRESGLSVVSYSGHYYEELLERSKSQPALRELLGCIDLLIDGPYDHQQAPGGLWRGSANQRLVPLSQRYVELCRQIDAQGPNRAIEIHVGNNNATWTGIFPPSLARRVTALTNGVSDVNTLTPSDQKE